MVNSVLTNNGSRIRIVELCLSVACLVVFSSVFFVPPAVQTALSDTLLGSVFGVLIWASPALLGGVTLYRAVSHGRSLGSYVTGILSVMILLLVILNVRAVITTDGLFSYGGRGMFFGPLIALCIGSVLGLVVLIEELLTNDTDQQRKRTA